MQQQPVGTHKNILISIVHRKYIEIMGHQENETGMCNL